MAIAPRIVCVECGGEAFLVQAPGEEDVLEAGDVLVYHCPECGHRLDIVLEAEDLDGTS
jgi:DNA-directed RNA polymerase subunit RPC12/RpoP